MPRAAGRILVVLLLLSAGSASELLIVRPNFGVGGMIGSALVWALLVAIVLLK